MTGMLILVTLINHRYVRRIAELEQNVRLFAKTKDAAVARAIRSDMRGRDEISSLSEGVVQMIEEIRDYVDNLVKVHQELDNARTNAAKMSELALKDGLTNIRNHTAYELEKDRLGECLSREDMAFAIVMVDLNDLKKINDTYGHEQGNAAIIQLSKIICETFKHSMVFRVGGDEFVVILMNEDYKNREALVSRIQAALEALKQDGSLQPWEKINAAVGLATYDTEKDNRVEDVFRRADARMYEIKKQMKARRS